MKDKMRKNASMVSEMVNSMSFKPEEFAEEMTKEHRTLQQTFTRTAIAWILKCASDDYITDGRNEASQEVAKDIVKAYKEMTGEDLDSLLPMI